MTVRNLLSPAALSFTAAIALAGCNVVPHQGIIAAHNISGHVLDYDTGRPIVGATVCVRYAKLDLAYYVNGVAETGTDGQFYIPANPEKVFLLDGPDAPQTPSLSVLHPDYASTGLLLKNFDSDRDLTIRLHPLSDFYLKSQYLDCGTSAKAH